MISSVLAWFAARDYSEQKIREKIEKKFPFSSSEEKEKTIEILKKENYINDERLAENWIRFWIESENISIVMIKQKLRTKKIPLHIISKVLEKKEINNKKAIQKTSEHKWISIKKLNIPIKKKQEKLLRFLLGRGFGWEESKKELNKLSEKNFEENL